MNDMIILLKAIVSGFALGFVYSIPLGPSGIESVKRTISEGFKEGFKVSLGAIGADMAYLILISRGFAGVLSRYKWAEALFWMISGVLLFSLGYHSIRNADTNSSVTPKFLKNSKYASMPFITGFLITFSNPMTPSLWIVFSSTIIRKWHSISIACYYSFILSIFAGMITWFLLLNIAALKGVRVLKPSRSAKTAIFLMWVILLTGVGFNIFGVVKLIMYFVGT